MKKNQIILAAGTVLVAGSVLLLNSCAAMPKGASVIQNLDPDKYLGKWYEIARFDFHFEKNLNNTTAQYSKNEDGSIRVLNRGYDYKKNKWKEAVGKAKFVESPQVGKLKVSFFGPFYAPYNIIELDNNYKYALVVGKNTRYIWFLSRTPTMPEKIKQKYVDKAQSLGYDLSKLVWVEHDKK